MQHAHGVQRTFVKTLNRSKMESILQERRERVMSGSKQKLPQPQESDDFRGVPIEEPMTASDIAAVTGVTTSWIRRLVQLGHMHKHEPKRGQRQITHYTGVVPVDYRKWQDEVKYMIRNSDRGHTAGIGADGRSVQLLAGQNRDKVEVLRYSIYRDQSETVLDRLASLLEIDRPKKEEHQQAEQPPQQQQETEAQTSLEEQRQGEA